MPIAMRSRRTLLAALIAGSAAAIAAGPATAADPVAAIPDTQVSGTVAQVLKISAPQTISLGNLIPGETSADTSNAKVTVIANSGYQVFAALTGGGDKGTLQMLATPPVAPAVQSPTDAKPSNFQQWETLGAPSSIGGRSYYGSTPAAGDDWGVSFHATPTGFPRAGDTLNWTVQFTLAVN